MSKQKDNEEYKGYTLIVTKNNSSKDTLNPYSGKATKTRGACFGNTENEVRQKLRKNIDLIENPEHKNRASTQNEEIQSKDINEKKDLLTSSSIITTECVEPKVDSSSISIEKLEHEVKTANKKLEKLHSIVEQQNKVIDKIETLTKISTGNKSNLDILHKSIEEKILHQDNLIQEVLENIKLLAQAEHVTQCLVDLRNKSDELHNRLDSKIDLKDADQIIELKNKLEDNIKSQLVYSLSQKIMPAVDILKKKVSDSDSDSEILNSVNQLIQRCQKAGLISTENLC